MKENARGNRQSTTLAVGAVLWFCGTLALGALIGAAASGEMDATQIGDVDWGPIWRAALAWVAFLNVPVWAFAVWRMRRR